MEYWHIKAELASGNLNGIIKLVEIFLRDVRDDCKAQGSVTASIIGKDFVEPFHLSFPRLTYEEALEFL